MNPLVAFYSFELGADRVAALEGIASRLCAAGLSVLVADWETDPALNCFKDVGPREGLTDLMRHHAASPGSESFRWIDYVTEVDVGAEVPLDLLRSGLTGSTFDWDEFYNDSDGGAFVERLRSEWKENYDVTLVNSPSGFDAASGVCVIQLADVLVPVIEASAADAFRLVEFTSAVQKDRNGFPIDRAQLMVFPLLRALVDARAGAPQDPALIEHQRRSMTIGALPTFPRNGSSSSRRYRLRVVR